MIENNALHKFNIEWYTQRLANLELVKLPETQHIKNFTLYSFELEKARSSVKEEV